MSVVCLDRAQIDSAGARWVNGVPAHSFVEAGIDPPSGDEDRGGGHRFNLIAGYGPHRLAIDGHAVLEVDMRLLVRRLQELARRYGAALIGGVSARGVDDAGLVTDAGTVKATWIIDASGLNAAGLLDQPGVAPEHLCAAAQEVREVVDAGAARAFFARYDVEFGDVACFTGVAGGYSIINVRADESTVGILTGSIPADGHPSGRRLLDSFVADQPWIGERIFGGSRAIPLRRPYDRLTDGRVGLLGDAGCQVFPGHGSGIGPGLIAARTIADQLARGAGLEGYAVHWQRKYGGLMASYDLFRRFSQRLADGELERMMVAGIMDPSLAIAGLEQRLPRPALDTILGKIAALARAPGLATRLGAVGARMAAANALYARYPEHPAQLPAWSRRIARVFGDPADL